MKPSLIFLNFLIYVFYSENTEKLQKAGDHSDSNYECEQISDCPYTGCTIINKIPWGDWPAGEPELSEDSDGEEEDNEESKESEESEIQAKEVYSVETEQDQEDAQYEKDLAAAASLSLTDQEGSQSVAAHLGGKSRVDLDLER